MKTGIMRVGLKTDVGMVKVKCNGHLVSLLVDGTMENAIRIKGMDKELWCGQQEKIMLENGEITRSMDLVFKHMQAEEDIKGIG